MKPKAEHNLIASQWALPVMTLMPHQRTSINVRTILNLVTFKGQKVRLTCSKFSLGLSIVTNYGIHTNYYSWCGNLIMLKMLYFDYSITV